MSEDRSHYLLSSVRNSLRILRSFSLAEPEKKVSDLAQDLGLAKSTVSRLLSTLASEGFVIKDRETQRFRPGLSILNLNTVLTSGLEINQESLPVLQQLVRDVDETAHIAALAGVDVVYLNIVECSHPVKILSHIGRRNPLHCTSSGKAMLAFQNSSAISQYIERGLTRYTDKTVTDPDEFRQLLDKVREQEYAVSSGELREGIESVAAPVRDYTGKVVYAVTVIGPETRIGPRLSAVVGRVRTAAREISRRLGHRKE